MRNQVLTDEEIRRIGDEARVHRDAAHVAESFARAVEQAVLAKCVNINGVYGIFSGPVAGYVTEVEARERERAAFFNGAREHGAGVEWAHVHKDERYPSLKPVEPPPLVLSTGTWSKGPTGGWHRGGGLYTEIGCRTSADARALADWLEKYGTP